MYESKISGAEWIFSLLLPDLFCGLLFREYKQI